MEHCQPTLTTGDTGTLPFGAARTRTGTAEDGPEGETVATSVRMGVKLASAAEADRVLRVPIGPQWTRFES